MMSVESMSLTGLKNSPPVAVEPTPWTVFLDRVRADSVPIVGGKAANLGALIAAGLPVPRGFCVTAEGFRRFLSSCSDMEPLWTKLESLQPQQSDEVQALGSEIRQRLAAVTVPILVRRAILAAWQTSGTMRAYAVRSSATAEDQPRTSFAGQGDTVLNVRGGKALLQAVRTCWISLFSDRAILYRIHERIDHHAAAMAVVVQEFITPDISGILFTADPVDGSAERIVIEASYGLGVGLVDGEVSPDRLVLSRPACEVLEQNIGAKNTEFVPDGSTRLRKRSVDIRRARVTCLDAATASHLAMLALEAERSLGSPQDVEWAIAGEQIFILQSRPITTLEQKVGPVRNVWSNMNSWEVLPDVLTPMSWSVINYQLKCLFRPLLKILDIDVDQQPIFGLIAGRAYANLNLFAQIICAVPGLRRMDFVEGLGGEQGDLLKGLVREAPAGDWRQRLRRAACWPRFLVWCITHAADQQSKFLLAEFHRRVDESACTDITAMSDDQLIDRIGVLLHLVKRFGPEVAAAVTVAMAFVSLYFHFVRGRAGNEGTAIANRMLGGLNGLPSADAGIDLWQLAAWARRRPLVRRNIAEVDDINAIRQRLALFAEGRMFIARWDEFLLRHGHHAIGELDIHNPRWSETPAVVLTQLRGYLDGLAAADPQWFQRRLARHRVESVGEFRRQLRNPIQREAFDYLYRKTQTGLTVRENARNELVRLLAAIRHTLVELGERLTGRGILVERDDIFFVELAELRSLVDGAAIGVKIAARKAEFAYHKSIIPPPIVVGQLESEKFQADDVHRLNDVLRGLAASAGLVTGRARVILHPQDGQRILPGEILVAPLADPGWTLYFVAAAGIVLDVGGMLSHGSIVAREYGIPAVVNVGSATRTISTGQMIRVDGDHGVVTVLGPSEKPS